MLLSILPCALPAPCGPTHSTAPVFAWQVLPFVPCCAAQTCRQDRALQPVRHASGDRVQTSLQLSCATTARRLHVQTDVSSLRPGSATSGAGSLWRETP